MTEEDLAGLSQEGYVTVWACPETMHSSAINGDGKSNLGSTNQQCKSTKGI